MTLHPDPTSLTPTSATPSTGRLILVGAGPGAADLLTLRALRHLQEADVVFYDRLIDPAVLALVNPRAQLRHVGKAVGANLWPQERICAEIIAAALRGQRVLRLKSGDPSIFGRAAEEIEAARRHAIPVEIVPGITAACAAAASLCQPLTTRGRSRQVVIASATGQSADDSCLPAALQPGSAYALYMAIHRIETLVAELSAQGLPPETAISIVSAASTAQERVLEAPLHRLAAEVRQQGIANPAILLFTMPALAEMPAAASQPQGMARAMAAS